MVGTGPNPDVTEELEWYVVAVVVVVVVFLFGSECLLYIYHRSRHEVARFVSPYLWKAYVLCCVTSSWLTTIKVNEDHHYLIMF